MKKTLTLLLALLCGAVIANEAKTVKLAPGIACYAWNLNVNERPKDPSLGGFVDTAEGFAGNNIGASDDLKILARDGHHNFVMWEGFLKIETDGQYKFAIQGDPRYATAKVYVNDRLLVQLQKGGPVTSVGTISLKPGMAKIRITFNNHNAEPRYTGFKLKYSRGNSMKSTDVTPAMLYHQVEDED